MLKRMVLALSMCCLAVSGCETTKRATEALRPDLTNPDRFICEAAGTRPKTPPEYQIDWSQVGQAPSVKVATERAKAEVAKLIGSIRSREGVVVGYVLQLEDRHFVCFNNMQWQRDFYRGLGQPAASPPSGAPSGNGGFAAIIAPSARALAVRRT